MNEIETFNFSSFESSFFLNSFYPIARDRDAKSLGSRSRQSNECSLTFVTLCIRSKSVTLPLSLHLVSLIVRHPCDRFAQP